MRFRPANPNDGLPNRHALIVAASGGGKSQLLAHGKVIPTGKNVRVLLWDDVGKVPGHYYRTKAGFLDALEAGIRSGKPFTIGYGGAQTMANYLWWWEVVWSVLDGRWLTVAAVEELAAVSPHAGAAPDLVQAAINQGRKYGLMFIGTTQQPEEISKTYYRQALTKYVGMADPDPESRRKMAKRAGVSVACIENLKPLEFYRNEGSAAGGQLVRVRYRETTGVHWHD